MFRIIHFQGYILLLFLIFSAESLYSKPSKLINAIELGFSEKGSNFNLVKTISDKNQISFGMHYFEGNVSYIEYSLIEPVPVFFSSKGLQLSFKHFLNGSSNKSRLFAAVGLELSSLNASSVINLSEQIYDLGNLTLTCRTCGNITIRTSNNFQLIPSFLFGWQKQIKDNLAFTIAAGFQYFNFPNVEWDSSKNANFPGYVEQKIHGITQNINKELKSYGNSLKKKFTALDQQKRISLR